MSTPTAHEVDGDDPYAADVAQSFRQHLADRIDIARSTRTPGEEIAAMVHSGYLPPTNLLASAAMTCTLAVALDVVRGESPGGAAAAMASFAVQTASPLVRTSTDVMDEVLHFARGWIEGLAGEPEAGRFLEALRAHLVPIDDE